MKKILFVFILVAFLFNVKLLTASPVSAVNVEKWGRFEVSYSNSSWSGNPFDLDLTATFTSPSGKNFTQFGFYAGNNVWKIYFMPDEVGTWTFKTISPDSDLNNKSGSFSAVSSSHPGPMGPVAGENRWKFVDAKQYVYPIMIPSRQYMKSTSNFGSFINWADNTVGASMIGTTLVYFSHEQSAIPYVKGEEGVTFNIPMWDRLNKHYDLMRDTGIGHYIMFFSDDGESPSRNGIAESSVEELRLFKYAAARFSAYPTVIWDTGIDIGEYRSNTWVNWFADWFVRNDPWSKYHGIGSRSGGGSGGINPSKATYYSDGDPGNGGKGLPTRSTFLSNFNNRSNPSAYTDRWREDYSRGNWDEHSIRRVMWRAALSGGPAIYVSGNNNGGYLDSSYSSDFKAGKYGGYLRDFLGGIVSAQKKLTPMDSILASGTNNGDHMVSGTAGQEYVAYLQFGGTVTLNLSGTSNSFNAVWFNPRNGSSSSAGTVNGGGNRSFTTPDSNDWVLHLKSGSVSLPTNTPTPTPTSGSLLGDADGDGDVDNDDYLIWKSNYNTTTSGGTSKGDFNSDINVNELDYVIWLVSFTG